MCCLYFVGNGSVFSWNNEANFSHSFANYYYHGQLNNENLKRSSYRTSVQTQPLGIDDCSESEIVKFIKKKFNMSTIIEDSETSSSQSHKGSRIKSYTLKFKIVAVKYVEINGNRAAAKKFSVDAKRIREWKTNKQLITELSLKLSGKYRKTLDGAGRKPLNELVDNRVLEWIYERRAKNLRVSCVLIMKKAKLIYDELDTSGKSESFLASRGWLEKFMRRNRLSLRRRISIAQKDPEQLIGKLVSYVVHNRRLQKKFNYASSQIYGMDETPVWQDMVGTTTVTKSGSKDVLLISTGHEKARVSVCLAARADGQKMKPFIVFQGAKRDVCKLNEEFRGKCVVVATENGWMNTASTIEWVQKVLGSFSFNKRMLARDSYECPMEQSVCKDLITKNIEPLIIPGGCTKYVQAPDVSWNKPFKAKVAEECDEWLSTVGINRVTEAGNLKSPERRIIVQWILKACNELSTEMSAKSFKSCALNIPIDGSEDSKIPCFKDGQPCQSGFDLLKQQLEVLDEPEVKPFALVGDLEVEEEMPLFLIVDQDGDEDLEVEEEMPLFLIVDQDGDEDLEVEEEMPLFLIVDQDGDEDLEVEEEMPLFLIVDQDGDEDLEVEEEMPLFLIVDQDGDEDLEVEEEMPLFLIVDQDGGEDLDIELSFHLSKTCFISYC